MHWNNGRFHGPVTLEKSLYITDNKYSAISEELYAGSITNGSIPAPKKVIMFGDNKIPSLITGEDIILNSKNRLVLQDPLNNTIYGTSLPNENNTKGRIFFKIIS
jgi:hypothetical protein